MPLVATIAEAPTMTALRERFQQAKQRTIDAYLEHRRAAVLLEDLSRIMDATLRALLHHHSLPTGATLAAVGGYGRAELYPYSDIDLLILLPHEPDEADQARISDLVTALWDLGIEPGHSVRTVQECRQEADGDITVETALLESRYLAGSRSLMRKFEAAMQERMDVPAFFLAKRIEMQQRHARYQDTPYALEPNCKESPGGLRDLQVILWMARAAGFGHTWRQIARAGMLNQDEARDLHRAELALRRLRIELHLAAKRREDRLVFDLQPTLATAYDIKPSATRRPSEILMQRYYWAAHTVSLLNTILVQNIEEHLFPRPENEALAIDDDFRNLRGRLDILRDNAFQHNPTLLLRAFLVMEQHAELSGMSARTLRAIWASRDGIDAQFRRNPVNRKLFLQLLQQPRGIVHELRRMSRLSILGAYLPAYRRITGQMQHDLFHVYTVDQHTLQVIRNLRRFTMTEHAEEYPLASQLASELADYWLLYAAALFHDIAKGRGGDHSELGAQEVVRFAREHGLSKDDRDTLEFLVRGHLHMSQVAQKRDLSDPDVIREFASVVRTKRRLTMLYLLTVADIRGTSPKVWNAWKGKLLEDLYRMTYAVLGGASPDAKTVLDERKAEAAQLADISAESRDAIWRQLDVAYFLRHDAPEIAWHTSQLSQHLQTDHTMVRARPTAQREGLQVMVYTRDTQDLFVSICAYFDAKDMDIQDARIHTTSHGWALDSFIILVPDYADDLDTLAAVIQRELAEHIQTREVNVSAPARAPAPYGRNRQSRLSRVFPLMPQVELSPDERSQSWRLSVTATDRHGLLHTLARVFANHHINLQTAKIMTLGDRAEDVFIVDGAELENPRTQLRFERALLDVLNMDSQAAA